MIRKLESLRGFAAIYVLIHHLIAFTELKDIVSPWRFPFRFGQEAVMLFFLLSGFVIYYSSHNKKLEAGNYFLKRFRRIYPIAIISFLVSVVVYMINKGDLNKISGQQLVGNLLMLQDFDNKPGLWFEVFLGNNALWSLSYEWIFYVLFFPFMFYLRDNVNRIYYILIFSSLSWVVYLIFPNHLSLVCSYLTIWWAGLESASIYLNDKKFTFRNMKHVIICLFTMTILTAIPIVLAFFESKTNFHQMKYPIITFRHFAFCTSVVMLGVLWWKIKLIGFSKILSPFNYFAPISYALYIIHIPIFRLEIPFIENLYILIAVKCFLIFILSYFLELIVQPRINKILS